jgi:hypothetical protein
MRSVPPLELITPASCVIGGRTFALGGETYIMGALNTSPESPNKESIVTSVAAARRITRPPRSASTRSAGAWSRSSRR